jgi:DNA-binding NarL/FixJ family response regulator
MNQSLTSLAEFRLIVVDDSDFARAQVISLLKQHGLTVVAEASTAEEALRQIKDKKPHLVVTDIVMPDVSGIQLTEKVMSDYTETGVIVLSSLQHENVVLEAIAAGAADFIAKPIKPTQLIEAVEKYLRGIGK